MGREIVLCLAKNAINVAGKTTSAKCVDPIRDPTSLSQSMTQESQARLMEDVPINVGCMKLMKSVKMTWRTRQSKSNHCSTHRKLIVKGNGQ